MTPRLRSKALFWITCRIFFDSELPAIEHVLNFLAHISCSDRKNGSATRC